MNSGISPVAYLDANIFIYGIEGAEEVATPIGKLFAAGRQMPGGLITSELSLAEVLGPRNKVKLTPPLQRLYMELMVWSGAVTLYPITRDVIYECNELRSVVSLKLPDAIHMATAILTKCRFLISRDRDFRRTPAWMEQVDPAANDVARVVAALS
jgi:predicted nucleic acid-binding protein